MAQPRRSSPPRRAPRRLVRGALSAVCGAAVLVASAWPGPVHAQAQKTTEAASKPADYRSQHFLLHTDLSAAEAKDLLVRLETMLRLVSTYWGRPCPGVIEAYVVKDLKNWPQGSLHPDGYAKIAAGAGVTLGQTLTSPTGAFLAKATVYAVADHGTPQHEGVHAYCIMAFGTTGPVWYAEGMAEMGNYWRERDSSVKLESVVLDYLKESKPKQLTEIVAPDQKTGDSWQNYSWRWALCHLLANNPNYASRFRPLGLALLTKQPTSFELVYGDQADQIQFEYHFFLAHIDQGYRVDLCAWDWSKKFTPLTTPARTISAFVLANKGWQPTALTVSAGGEYHYTATGTWKTSADAAMVDAAGASDGRGRLEAVLLKDYKLSEPFELGPAGSFKAPADGDLYVRCRDSWNELADNAGRVNLKLNVK
jgi:hypothetical protein